MRHLCCLRSYVVLGGQDVWNEALRGSGLYITIFFDAARRLFNIRPGAIRAKIRATGK